MKRVLTLAPLIALLFVVALSAFLLMRGSAPQAITAGEIGRQAPPYALVRLGGGEPVTSASMRGRAHLINIFASWCTPCRAEHPQLLALRQSGVEIVGVAYKDTPDAAARFLNELGDPFSAVALDPDGRFSLELGTAGVPETFVIGADGAILAVHRGPLTREIIEDVILPELSDVR